MNSLLMRYAMLVSLCFALGARRDATALKIMRPEQKTTRGEATMRNVFKPDSRPIVAEQQLSLEQLAKTYYHKGETRRKIEVPAIPIQRRVTTAGAGTKRKLTTQAVATAATQRKIGGQTRSPAISSRALRPAGTLRRVQPVQLSREKVSKGYVAKNPTARQIAVPKRAPVAETRRQMMKPAQSVRVVAKPPPDSVSQRHAKRRPTAQTVQSPTKPAVLQQVNKTRRVATKPAASTRRVLSVAPAPKPVALRAETNRHMMGRSRGPVAVRMESEDEYEEVVAPVRTLRRAEATARRMVPVKKPAMKPVYVTKKPVKCPVARSESMSEEVVSSSEPAPTKARGKVQRKKTVQTVRKVEPTKRKQTVQTRRKVVESSESESSTSSFGRQFSKRKVLTKSSKAKKSKRQVSSSSEAVETEVSSSSTSEPSISSSSLAAPPAKTKRKAKPGMTMRKVTKPAKKTLSKGKKLVPESVSESETSESSVKEVTKRPTRKTKPEATKKPSKKLTKKEIVESESETESSAPKAPKKEATRAAFKKPEATTRRAARAAKEPTESSIKTPAKKPKKEAATTRRNVTAKPEQSARKIVETKRKLNVPPKKEEPKKKTKKRVVSSSTSSEQEESSSSSESEVDSSEGVSESSTSSSSHRPAKTRRAVTSAKPAKNKSPVANYKTKGRR